ncbi:hypothetical protein J2T60_001710 [Natronospira proteinivora]|uniref:Polyketide cyclase/dehydrase/lipid transport protein n=1 Tax=Natronospira proteinivora TaxID=1807133 RepID=A0ABT1G8T9_9GAMM|nr:hypothetical protein [Natronospira proteinivora]MCP1727710.1 hypothetical protein [Natronospira proteinivora]
MSILQKALATVAVVIMVLAGLFLIVGAVLPDSRVGEAMEESCHPLERVYPSFREPEALAAWFFPDSMDEVSILDDGVRWRDGERWLRVDVTDSRMESFVHYEVAQEGRFSMPVKVRMQALENGGSRLDIRADASAETVFGRWFLVLPDLLQWLGLPNQNLDEAMKRISDQALEHLDNDYGPCRSD